MVERCNVEQVQLIFSYRHKIRSTSIDWCEHGAWREVVTKVFLHHINYRFVICNYSININKLNFQSWKIIVILGILITNIRVLYNRLRQVFSYLSFNHILDDWDRLFVCDEDKYLVICLQGPRK